MGSKIKIQTIQPSRVIHELISKPIGTYIIRHSTENDQIQSQINNKSEINSQSYVVLSIRVNESLYQFPIMYYRLPTDNINLDNYDLPDLIQECIVTEDTNWEMNQGLFRGTYLSVFAKDNDSNLSGKTTYNNSIDVYNKTYLNDEDNFQHELSLLKDVCYFHIVSFYGICSESNQIKHLVLGDHGESLKSQYPSIKYPNKLMIKQLGSIGYQIACGMIYLEYKNIIHRDLHAGNILIDKNGFIRIADFGHAVRKDEKNQLIRNFQPRRRAPECLPTPPENGQFVDTEESLLENFSSKSDVWAYGLIFMELQEENEDVYPNIPIVSGDDEIIQFVDYIKINQNIHDKPVNCPKNFYNLLKQCWSYDPDDRISFTDLQKQMMILADNHD